MVHTHELQKRHTSVIQNIPQYIVQVVKCTGDVEVWDPAVGIATRYGLDDPGLEPL